MTTFNPLLGASLGASHPDKLWTDTLSDRISRRIIFARSPDFFQIRFTRFLSVL